MKFFQYILLFKRRYDIINKVNLGKMQGWFGESTTMTKKVSSWLLTILWMGMIFYSSATPYEKQDVKPLLSETMDLTFLAPILKPFAFTYNKSIISVQALGVEGYIEFFLRKGAHIFVFMVLCILFYCSFKQTINRTILFNAFLCTCLYAIFDEWHQSITPNRTPYIGDVFLDSFGALLAVLLILVVKRLRMRRRLKTNTQKQL